MRALAFWLGLLAAMPAFACGVCVEDKIAACYDHGIVTSAKARGHAVAFYAIHGDLPRSAALAVELRTRIEGARGVGTGTARVSLENAAFSFAFDPARTSAAAVQRLLARPLRTRGLELQLLRVMGPKGQRDS